MSIRAFPTVQMLFLEGSLVLRPLHVQCSFNSCFRWKPIFEWPRVLIKPVNLFLEPFFPMGICGSIWHSVELSSRENTPGESSQDSFTVETENWNCGSRANFSVIYDKQLRQPRSLKAITFSRSQTPWRNPNPLRVCERISPGLQFTL